MEKASPSDTLKGPLAIASALCIFIAYAFPGYIAGLLKLLKSNGELPDSFRSIPGKCAETIEKVCLERILDARVQIEGVIPACKPSEERIVYIANHPTTNALPSLMSFLSQHFAPFLVILSKQENLYHPTAPLNFWPMALMNACLFIDRQGGEKTIAQLKQQTSSILTTNAGLMMFPDSRRPTTKAIAASQDKHGPLVTEVPQYTCSPRSGGLWTVMEALNEYKTRCINITIAFDRADETLRDAGVLSGATLHIHSEDVTNQLPNNKEELGVWLNTEWKRKNARIHEWKTS